MPDVPLSFDDWNAGVVVKPVDSMGSRHTIHSYFVTCPESPDGRQIVCFAATGPEAHVGQIMAIDRQNGQTRVLDDNITVEDAHRQAYQQWSAGGRYVVYVDLCHDVWQVRRVDTITGHIDVLAEDRQIGFGQPLGNQIPLMGLHWQPGEHRDLELLDVDTGQFKTALTAEQLREALPEVIARDHGDAPISIFFPVISPDQNRIFFKISSVKSGEFRGKEASRRTGLCVYDQKLRKIIFYTDVWGHPAWHPDSRHIVTPVKERLIVIDCEKGTTIEPEGLPSVPGSHPCYAPNGRLISTDCYDRGEGVPRGHWGVVVIDPPTHQVAKIHQLHHLPGGSTSWRPPHPHPVFNADGRRLYFNVSSGRWTRLHVAEVTRRHEPVADSR